MYMLALLPLLACGGSVAPTVKDDTADTADSPVCGRVRGTGGVLLYQEDATVVRTPADTPQPTETGTGIAGPLDDAGLQWMAVVGGRVFLSEDAGCNWEPRGSLPPDGDWALRGARTDTGARVYAFARATGAIARTDDLGRSWEAFDADGTFVGVPVVAAADPERLRGVQARGVVTSTDGGASWTVTGTLPPGMSAPRGADVWAGDLDTVWVAGPGGAWESNGGGAGWQQRYDAGDAYNVAVMPDEGTGAWVLARTTDGLLATWSWDGDAADSGETVPSWDRALDEVQAPIVESSPLWPIPGEPTRALSAHGPVTSNAGDPAVNLYLMEGGTGTRTVRVGTFVGIRDLGFGDDRWLAVVTPAP